MPRPPIDIVVPFVGSDDALASLVRCFDVIELSEGDTLTIADNRPAAAPGARPLGRAMVRGAAGQASSYFARNRGAEAGTNPWLVFLDADVVPSADLLEQYFSSEPAEGVGILIGGIYDEPPRAGRPSAVEQYSFRRGAVGHATTTRTDRFTFAQTANVAVRRDAFEAVGGFTEGVRSGGDADLCFRIQAAGFSMDPRYEARVQHRNRTTLKAFVRQYARYGSGAAWLNSQHPGFSPRPNPLRILVALGASLVRTSVSLARGRKIDAQVYALDGVQWVASTVGRLASNQVDR